MLLQWLAEGCCGGTRSLALQRGRGFCSRVAGGTVGYIQAKQGTEKQEGRKGRKRRQNPLQNIEKISSQDRGDSTGLSPMRHSTYIYPCSAVHRVDITLHSKSAWYPGIIDAGLNPGDNPDMTNHRLVLELIPDLRYSLAIKRKIKRVLHESSRVGIHVCQLAPFAIRISLRTTRPPNYPSKVPKHASRNLADGLTVRKERDFTLGWNESFRVSHTEHGIE
ncbi:hypothetical protein ALC62_11625 [Cyphomyrmex costatus]|uniref:Uncharacterized protein n=1 Tax=Cyphomyrmex costatus TaxID=456900 RepID=A0A151IC64_9HYME|nr:hypothetical protein ALC62_11625 [Cyphomyrmex costatus]